MCASLLDNMSSAPLPDDVSSAPLPDDVSSAPLPDDMSSALQKKIGLTSLKSQKQLTGQPDN